MAVDHLSEFREGLKKIVYIADLIRYVIDKYPDASQQEASGMLLNFFRNTQVEDVPLLGARELGGKLYYPGMSYDQNIEHILEFFALAADKKIIMNNDGSLSGNVGFYFSKKHNQKLHWQDLGFDRHQVQLFFDYHELGIDVNSPPSYLPPETSAEKYNTESANTETITENYFGHNSEGIELLRDVIEQFWSTYCPDQKDTAPRKQDVIDYLVAKGVPTNLAKAVDMVLRPGTLKTGGRPKSKRV